VSDNPPVTRAHLPTSCAHATLGKRAVSTYTVLGFVGYAIASSMGGALVSAWGFRFVDRVVTIFVPPIAFLIVLAITRVIVGRERIVFYQTACAAIVATAVLASIVGGQVARTVDVVVLGIGVFLVFGRIGCFSVACCHGVPARFGVVYGAEHARAGFWARWVGRPLWPTQLVECASSAVLVVAGLIAGWSSPGVPALIYLTGYGAVRFALELVRGDSTRPYWLGLSEAQWTACATLLACAVLDRSLLTALPLGAVIVGALWLIKRRTRRAPFLSSHLYELDRACRAVQTAGDGARRETSLGVAVSVHALPDGRTDWILSATQPWWSIDAARRLAASLWSELELVPGRAGSIVHVLVKDR
jgi:hypothetical protein